MNRAIQQMFDGLPHVYELINHIVSLGLDVPWRKAAARLASQRGGTMWLDVSTGTGEMAAYLRWLAGPDTTVVASDFSLPMLMEARKKRGGGKRRAAERGSTSLGVQFVLADTGRLPFKLDSFDLVTISLATRNITTSEMALLACLREFHRILKPGGWFVNLETSQPTSPLVRWLFHKYVDGFLGPVGVLLSGSQSAYAYLSRTIRGFYEPEQLATLINKAGFKTAEVRRLFLGVAAIHRAVKVGKR